MKKTNVGGFTLVELVIVVLIIAILMAYVIPSYRNYVLRANRTEATNALTQISHMQERFYANNNTYGSAADLNLAAMFPAPSNANGLWYAISMNSTATTYTIRADAARGQVEDTPCLFFSLDNLGTRGSTTPGECW